MTSSNSSDAGFDKAATSVGESIASAGDATHKLKETAQEIGAGTADAVHRAANAKAADVGDALQMIASKLSEARSEISEPLIGKLVDQAESTIRSTARAAKHASPTQSIAVAMTFAREHPALTIGAAIALGFGLARAGKVAVRELSETKDETADRDVAKGGDTPNIFSGD